MKTTMKSFLIAGILVLSTAAQASTALECRTLVQELTSMQKAQTSLLKSFVSKNDLVANSLETQAKRFDQRRQMKKGITTAEVSSLKDSAQDFRAHKQREAQLVARFEKATNELLSEVSRCLSSQTTTAQADKLGQR